MLLGLFAGLAALGLAASVALWDATSTGVDARLAATALPRGLAPGQVLDPGQSLGVRGFRLTLQSDGALVAERATSHGFVRYWSNGVQAPGSTLEMDPGGDVVERSPGGAPVWSVGASRAGSCLLPSVTYGTTAVPYPNDLFGLWPLWTVAPCYEGLAGAPRVAMIGDSITWYSELAIGGTLGRHTSYVLSGMFGFRMAQQLTALDGLLHDPAGPPDDVVLELGTNDVLQGDGQWQVPLARALRATTDQCVLLVDVAHHDPQLPEFDGAVARQIDRAFARAAETHPNVHLVDWNAVLRRHPPGDDWLMPDGVHPDSAGQQALARAVLDGLQRWCGTVSTTAAP